MKEGKVEITIDDKWIRLDVKGDITISYPVYGEDRNKFVDSFAVDLKKALNGQRISALMYEHNTNS